MDQLSNYLKHAGATLEDLVKVTVPFKIGENFDEMKPVFKEYFPNGFPIRNTILIPQFLGENIKLQIEGVAYKPELPIIEATIQTIRNLLPIK